MKSLIVIDEPMLRPLMHYLNKICLIAQNSANNKRNFRLIQLDVGMTTTSEA